MRTFVLDYDASCNVFCSSLLTLSLMQSLCTCSILTHRIQYDKKCDAVIAMWREKTQYDPKDAEEMEAQHERYDKRSSNNAKAKSMSAFDKATTKGSYGLYVTSGQVTNEWRISVITAIHKEGRTNVEVARAIRNNCYGSWDGNCREKTYAKVYAKVQSVEKAYKDKSLLYGDSLEELSSTDKRKYLASKTVKLKAKRGNAVRKGVAELEEKLLTRLSELREKGCRISRGVMFREAHKINPSFANNGRMKELKNWLYYGFRRRANLSYTRSSGAGQKMPKDWEPKKQTINDAVNRTMLPHVVEIDGSDVTIAAPPSAVVNTDHVPVNREAPSEYTWDKKNSGRRPIRTGGKEKERFTVQLSVRFSRKDNKLPPLIIWKANPNANPDHRNTVLYEITHRDSPDAEDKAGNKHPPKEKVAMAVSETANSSGELTVHILNEVILPGIGVVDDDGNANDNAGTILVDDFRGHGRDVVRERVAEIPRLSFNVMAGGITPVAQPLDILVNKPFKAFYRDLYDEYMLTAPENPQTGNPIPPSRQLCSTWVLKAWEAVPEEIIYKAWLLGGYKDPSCEPNPNDPLSTAIINATSDDDRRNLMVQMVQNEMGDEAVQDFVNQLDFDGSDDEDDHYSIIEALEAKKRSKKEYAWVEEPEDGASELKPGDTVLFYFEWGWERGIVHQMSKCSQHQKEMAESYTTPVLVRYVIDGDYMLQDFGSLFDALYLPEENFDELCSGKSEASLDIPPKSWCIVKLESE